MITVNHISIFEPPFILSFWPRAPEVIAAVDIRERRFQELLVRMYGALRVHRGDYDREVIDGAIAALSSGKPVLVFPEGGRSHTPGLRRALPGAAFLVEKTGILIVPVGVIGSTDDFFQRALHGARPILEMRIGPSFTLPAVTGKGTERRCSRQRNADLIMDHIAAILPPEYRGVYAETAFRDLPA